MATMDIDWQPQTTEHVQHGRTMRKWTWKGHSLVYRGDTPSTWAAFKAECWEIVQRLEAGESHVHHAHHGRHDPNKRPVSVPQRLDMGEHIADLEGDD